MELDKPSPDAPLFTALITPHRSLGPRGLRLVITLVCLASIVSSIPFVVLGAWPVAGFFGLDVVALFIALAVNMRDARGFEEVVLTRVELLLRQVSPQGAEREWRFNPLWTRLNKRVHPELGVERLSLASRGLDVPLGQALSAEEKASFGDALGAALARAKQG
jgi:uncharacterized membrane protein